MEVVSYTVNCTYDSKKNKRNFFFVKSRTHDWWVFAMIRYRRTKAFYSLQLTKNWSANPAKHLNNQRNSHQNFSKLTHSKFQNSAGRQWQKKNNKRRKEENSLRYSEWDVCALGQWRLYRFYMKNWMYFLLLFSLLFLSATAALSFFFHFTLSVLAIYEKKKIRSRIFLCKLNKSNWKWRNSMRFASCALI